MSLKPQVHIHWFRKGLRLHDNPALQKALDKNVPILPLFILDSHFARPDYCGVNRYAFLLECLKDLDKSLSAHGLKLLVAKDPATPKDLFKKLFKTLDVKMLTFETDTEPYAKKRDKEILDLCRESKVQVFHYSTHTLFDLDELYADNDFEQPKTYQGFLKLIGGKKVAKPIDTFAGVKDLKTISAKDIKDVVFWDKLPNVDQIEAYKGHKVEKFIKGGESQAILTMEKFMKNEQKTAYFEKPKTIPTSLKPDTTALSPHIKFGTLSARTFWWRTQEIYDKFKNHAKPPESLHGQMYFREYFYFCGHFTPNFDKMKGNKDCRQIDWDDNKEYLEAWEHGRTGYPAIDAAMRQLKQTGWMHHLARHLTACFLTRGDLWVSWEQGAKVFERYLLDADWSLNNANWQWLSTSRFFYQYFRVYSPVAFFQKYDKEGIYVKEFCPELKNFPAKFIYEPWKASKEDQKKWGCIIGKDYPHPIVDHQIVNPANQARMKKIVAKANGEKVLSTEEAKSSSPIKKGAQAKRQTEFIQKRKAKETTQRRNTLDKFMQKATQKKKKDESSSESEASCTDSSGEDSAYSVKSD